MPDPARSGALPDTFLFLGHDFDRATGTLDLHYGFSNGARFTERLEFHAPFPALDPVREAGLAAAVRTLHVLAGLSYYKLHAPLLLDLGGMAADPAELAFYRQTYEEGLGEFAHRNGLDLAGKLVFGHAGAPDPAPRAAPALSAAPTAVLIGGGKDSLVSLEALLHADEPLVLFAVNPRQPMRDCAAIAGKRLIEVTRTLSGELFRLNGTPGTYNGHVPITAIVSMIAVVAAYAHGFGAIVLSNERSADEPTLRDGDLAVNHQYSKTSSFGDALAAHIDRWIAPGLAYFSLLRPLSELHIARLFARTDRYDRVFTSCNKAFRLMGRPDSLWCGDCAKCRFTFLMMAPVMPRERLLAIFGRDMLASEDQVAGYRELTGLADHKPWDCVGEELESIVALMDLARQPQWADAAVIRALAPLLADFGPRADESCADFLTPHWQAQMPEHFKQALRAYVG